jgi:hypothetical protein
MVEALGFWIGHVREGERKIATGSCYYINLDCASQTGKSTMIAPGYHPPCLITQAGGPMREQSSARPKHPNLWPEGDRAWLRISLGVGKDVSVPLASAGTHAAGPMKPIVMLGRLLCCR